MKKSDFYIILIALSQTFCFSRDNRSAIIKHQTFSTVIKTLDITIPYIRFKVNSTETFWEKNDNEKNVSPEEVIDILYRLLVDNPTMKMQVTGHCDYDEKNKYKLSLNRAQYVIGEVIKKGISKDRLIALGLGIESPLAKLDIIKNAKTKQEKESLRQKNRRVTVSALMG
jgi:outer membrane protein OmpA-like peptidoglycan-associated protein